MEMWSTKYLIFVLFVWVNSAESYVYRRVRVRRTTTIDTPTIAPSVTTVQDRSSNYKEIEAGISSVAPFVNVVEESSDEEIEAGISTVVPAVTTVKESSNDKDLQDVTPTAEPFVPIVNEESSNDKGNEAGSLTVVPIVAIVTDESSNEKEIEAETPTVAPIASTVSDDKEIQGVTPTAVPFVPILNEESSSDKEIEVGSPTALPIIPIVNEESSNDKGIEAGKPTVAPIVAIVTDEPSNDKDIEVETPTVAPIASSGSDEKVIEVGTSTAAPTVVTVTEESSNYKDPIVSTEDGKLRGSIETLYDGSQYYSFKGIPYAEAPVGILRFKAPLPSKPWRHIRNATEHGPVCIQYDSTVNQYIEGSEDCLFLNVYTRSLDSSAKIPVMVYIHGGSYMSGSGNSDTYSPHLLLQHDVILVTMNYRLEVLGFLSLNNGDVPGNAGMKDQVAALRWIQDNIEQFGGDPDSVTLFGESSGASAVTYHMLSPMSKGLFHKAIVQSGVCLEDWAQGHGAVDRAFRVGKVLGKEFKDKTALVEFLREVSPLNLTNLTYKTLARDEMYRGLPEHFVPIVEETFHPGPETFIREDPAQLLLKGKVNKVPLMIGYNSGEGLFMLDYQLQNLQLHNRYPTNFVPRSLVERLSEEKIIQFGRRIKRFYVGKRQITRHDLYQLRDIQTDVNYAYNTHRFAHMYQSLNESVYMYRFDYDTELNIVKQYTGYTSLKGASHADDLFYLFYNSLNKKLIDNNPDLKEITYRMTKMWTNFAKFGRPTPHDSFGVIWTPYTAEGREYLKLGEPMVMDKNADKLRIDFWNKLYRDANLPYIKNKDA